MDTNQKITIGIAIIVPIVICLIQIWYNRRIFKKTKEYNEQQYLKNLGLEPIKLCLKDIKNIELDFFENILTHLFIFKNYFEMNQKKQELKIFSILFSITNKYCLDIKTEGSKNSVLSKEEKQYVKSIIRNAFLKTTQGSIYTLKSIFKYKDICNYFIIKNVENENSKPEEEVMEWIKKNKKWVSTRIFKGISKEYDELLLIKQEQEK